MTTKYKLTKVSDVLTGSWLKLTSLDESRKELFELLTALNNGETIVIPKYEQSRGRDVYVKLSDDTYPQTMISTTLTNNVPSTWSNYAISIDALSTYPCYVFNSKRIELKNDNINVIPVGTVIRYLATKPLNDTDDLKRTATVKASYFYQTDAGTSTSTTTVPVSTSTSTTTAPTIVQHDNSTKIIFPNGDYSTIEGQETISSSGYNDWEAFKSTSTTTTTKALTEAEVGGFVVYTLDNESGFFKLVTDTDTSEQDQSVVTFQN